MDTFLTIFIVLVLALAGIGWLADRRSVKSSRRHAGTFASPGGHQV